MPVAAAFAPTTASLAVVIASTATVYFFLLALLRLFGRRQLGQLTMLDLVVVLLLGSAVETAMIHGNLSLTAGLASAATLLVCNRLLTLIFARFDRWSYLVNGGPIILVHNGRAIEEHLKRVGMTGDDLDAALRSRGYLDKANVREAVLESDGTVSVIEQGPTQNPGTSTTQRP